MLLAEAIAEAENDTDDALAYADTLTIEHATFTQPLRVVRGFDPLHVADVQYIPAWFDLKLPEKQAKANEVMTIDISNINRDTSHYLRNASQSQTPVTVLWQMFRITINAVQLVAKFDLAMDIARVSIANGKVSATCQHPDFLNMPFGNLKYNVTDFRGLLAVR